MYDYLVAHEDSAVYSSYGQQPSPRKSTSVTLRYVNESIQRVELQNLASKIKQLTPNEDDQARIAISLVQNIPYDWNALSTNSLDWKYPYEVLYTNTGVCSQKSMLLVCLLRELGYGCSILEFSNHAAVGIACPSQYAYYSGYAFVNTSDHNYSCYENYVSLGKLPSAQDMSLSFKTGKLWVPSLKNPVVRHIVLWLTGSVLDESHYALQAIVGKWNGFHAYALGNGTNLNA